MNEAEMKENMKNYLCENLGIPAEILEYDTPLFGDSEIGLDSIDSLEIISYVDSEYGIQMTGVGREHFQTIDTIVAYITAHSAN